MVEGVHEDQISLHRRAEDFFRASGPEIVRQARAAVASRLPHRHLPRQPQQHLSIPWFGRDFGSSSSGNSTSRNTSDVAANSAALHQRCPLIAALSMSSKAEVSTSNAGTLAM